MDSEDKETCDRTPPSVNWKCIWFTLALAGGYWFIPPKNKWVLVALLYFPYLVLAWYDHWYACERVLGPSYLALFYAWAKPKSSDQIQRYKNWCPDLRRRVLIVDMIILLLALTLLPSFLAWDPSM